ncbi:unnamed protein product, partial [Meganyctiphanes norvegica]
MLSELTYFVLLNCSLGDIFPGHLTIVGLTHFLFIFLVVKVICIRKYISLPKFNSPISLIHFPYFIYSSHFNAPLDDDSNNTTKHEDCLKCVCIYNRLGVPAKR